MSRYKAACALTARRRGFTIVEMLVVISIIAILAGLILPAVIRSRREARAAQCLSNLHQIGIALSVYAQHYGDGRPDGFPPWLTLLTKKIGNRKYLDDPRVLICPDDPSRGAEGGRPDNVRDTGGEIIDQFEMADIDEHSGPLNGVGPKNDKDGGKNCSYLFEFCGEPCDWIYWDEKPPIDSNDVPAVPPGDENNPYEWRWGTMPGAWPTPPAAQARFRQMVDRDRSGVLSWNEVKVFSQRGCKEFGLAGWHIRVPICRCYWHMEGQSVLKDDSVVLDLLGDSSSVKRGVPAWYK